MADEQKQPKISEEELKMPEEQFGPYADTEKKSSVTTIVLVMLVALLVLILIGLYLWSTMLRDDTPVQQETVPRPTAEENNEPETNNADADVQALRTMSNSDELSAIEADIESTNLGMLNAEMNQIEAELQ